MAISIKEIKNELAQKSKVDILEYCVRLSRFKKENKELLYFLLFQKDDLTAFIEQVNAETQAGFEALNTNSIYFIKKGVRKILRELNKKNRFALASEVESETLSYFCNCMNEYAIPMQKSTQLKNIYEAQLQKIEKSLDKLHPDLQYDLRQKLKSKRD